MEREEETQEQMIADIGGDNRHPDHSLANNTIIWLIGTADGHLARRRTPRRLFSNTGFDRVAKSFKDLIMMLTAIFLPTVCSKESPFKTNAAKMWVLVVATIIYCLARLSNADVAVISGSLSTVSLISIFLPHSLGFLIFIPWSLVPLIVAYQPIRSIFYKIHDACLRLDQQMIMDFISKFSVIWTWLTRSNSSEQEQEQPRPRVSP